MAFFRIFIYIDTVSPHQKEKSHDGRAGTSGSGTCGVRTSHRSTADHSRAGRDLRLPPGATALHSTARLPQEDRRLRGDLQRALHRALPPPTGPTLPRGGGTVRLGVSVSRPRVRRRWSTPSAQSSPRRSSTASSAGFAGGSFAYSFRNGSGSFVSETASLLHAPRKNIP